MNFEPKVTDRAAFVALWHNGELLVLQSRKWRTEGTPYLLPGGGFKANDSFMSCAGRELFEETCIGLISPDFLVRFGSHQTEWTNEAVFYECDAATSKTVYGRSLELREIKLEPKLYGYEWWNFEEDKLRIQALKPFMMPGLKWYLEQKGLL